MSKSVCSLKSYCNLDWGGNLKCHNFFSNFALFLAQKVEYLKNYITYGGNILEGLYYCFCGSEKKNCQNIYNSKKVS